MGGGEHASSGLNREQESDGGEAGQQWAPRSAFSGWLWGESPHVQDTMPRRHPSNEGDWAWNLVSPLWTAVVSEPDLETMRSLGGWALPRSQEEVVREERVPGVARGAVSPVMALTLTPV